MSDIDYWDDWHRRDRAQSLCGELIEKIRLCNDNPAEDEYISATKRILDAGADPNYPKQDRDFYTTPLHRSIAQDVRFLVMLFEYGADLNIRNRCGETALIESCHVRPSDAMTRWQRKVIELGADVNIADPITGMTPLHMAVKEKNHILIRCLIRAGAAPYALSAVGQRPLQLSTDAHTTSVFDEELNRLNMKIAFAQASHVRLGEHSYLNGLEEEVMANVSDLVWGGGLDIESRPSSSV